MKKNDKKETNVHEQQINEFSKFAPIEFAKSIFGKITEFDEMAKTLSINNDQDLQKVTDMLSEVKGQNKQVEAERTKEVKPHNDKVRDINGGFKKVTNILTSIEGSFKNAIIQYHKRKEIAAAEEQMRLNKAREDEQKRLDKEHEKNIGKLQKQGYDTSIIPKKELEQEQFIATAPETNIQGNSGGSANIKKVWLFKVTNPELVPRKYLVVDESAIRKAVVAGEREIQGVNIYQDYNVSAKSK